MKVTQQANCGTIAAFCGIVAALLAGGCTPAEAELVVPLAASATLAPASPTTMPTPSFTATATATATAAAAATALPTPTPTAQPPDVALSLSLKQVVQGHVTTVHVTASRLVTVTGRVGDRSLVLTELADGEYWTAIGIHAMAQVGPREVLIQAFDELGREIRKRATLDVAAGGYVTETINLSPETAALLDPALLEAERERLEALWAKLTPRQLWHDVWARPGGGDTTSGFGTRRAYGGGPATDYHAGQDFRAEKSDPVMAPAAGVVVLAEPLDVRGNSVWLDHGLGVYSGYFHLSEIAVEVGQAVEQGDLLGRVGSTGLSTGPHIHWEVRVHGIAVDPLEWTEHWIGPPLRLRIDDSVR
ncbi:MAG: Murein DD-endopeptidase MepM [Anaerolineales bacterium]|nr:Murein DD-endopeptidase MepM [Anaerolineales bacterium]